VTLGDGEASLGFFFVTVHGGASGAVGAISSAGDGCRRRVRPRDDLLCQGKAFALV